MVTLQLPPQLAGLHRQLGVSTHAHAKSLQDELELMSEVVAHARTVSPDAPAIRKFDLVLRKGFTGGSGASCKCCGRPF